MDNEYKTKIANRLNNKNKSFSSIEFSQHFINNQRKKSNRKVFSNVFKDYVTNTTLHGIKYLGPETSTFAEKLCWIVGCILSILCCGYLIYNVWNKWETSPVILSFNQEQTPIWEIPFPAVTVCPTAKVDQERYNFTKIFRSRNILNSLDYKKFWDISLICDLDVLDELMDRKMIMNFTDEAVVTNINNVNFNDSIVNIRWLNSKVNGTDSDFFVRQITEEGICYTFNSFRNKDMYTEKVSKTMEYIIHGKENVGWTMENGYPKNASFDGYPKRTTDNGFVSGLSFMINFKVDTRDLICGLPFSGFKIIVHNPAEPARPGQEYILTTLDQQHTIIVRPEMTVTDPALVSLNPHIRKCFFANERSLKFFKVYTLNNCRTECLANITLNSCGCVPFYMPREMETKICGFGKLDCVVNMQSKMLKYKIANEIVTDSQETLEAEIYSKCNCLPSCASLSFSAEISQSKLHYLTKLRKMDEANDGSYDINKPINYTFHENYQLSKIDIFYKEAQFLALYRGELFGTTDFFANIGGLLGLFMGFSVLSLLEFIYYFSIHLWCRIKRDNNND